MSIRQQIKQQKAANKASLKYYAHFEEHRRQQTDLILSSAGNGARICILGAGNCFDMDLQSLSDHAQEIHLVDIDRDAITAAKKRLLGARADKVFLHCPVDVSGAHGRLEDWRDFKVAEQSFLEFPNLAVSQVVNRLPGPFDCVVSSCLISQILLTCTNVMGEQHALLQAGLVTLLVAHLRVMIALTKSAGNALWISDVSSNEIAPIGRTNHSDNPIELLHHLASSNRIFNYLDPALIRELAEQDPNVAEMASVRDSLKAWLWHNGPHNTFLVYAMNFSRSGFSNSGEIMQHSR